MIVDGGNLKQLFFHPSPLAVGAAQPAEDVAHFGVTVAPVQHKGHGIPGNGGGKQDVAALGYQRAVFRHIGNFVPHGLKGVVKLGILVAAGYHKAGALCLHAAQDLPKAGLVVHPPAAQKRTVHVHGYHLDRLHTLLVLSVAVWFSAT